METTSGGSIPRKRRVALPRLRLREGDHRRLHVPSRGPHGRQDDDVGGQPLRAAARPPASDPAPDDDVLLEASFTTDENGYRNASSLLERYPIAVSGDSFTSLSIEPRPWPSILSEKVSAPVLNLGLPGYGPQQETQALIRFGLPRKPEWVILAYFEGNDLTPAFREAASRGEALYLTNDTHWSAAGHELAASVIAERLRRGR